MKNKDSKTEKPCNIDIVNGSFLDEEDSQLIDRHCSTCHFNQNYHFEMPCLVCDNFNKWKVNSW